MIKVRVKEVPHFLKSRQILRKYALVRHKQWAMCILCLNIICPFDLDVTTKDKKILAQQAWLSG